MGICVSRETILTTKKRAKNDRPEESTDYAGIRENMVRQSMNQDVFQFYEIIRTIGEGSIGSVSEVRPKSNSARLLAEHNNNQRTYALKRILLDRVKPSFVQELRNEIDILKTLDHPNIVKVYETFERRTNIFIVLEYCSGGDLYERSPYSERAASKIVAKILSAVSFLHKNNIVHRDLKYENILFESCHPDAEIKVIDFGLSKRFVRQSSSRLLPDNEYMMEGVGTIYTMAPQVLKGLYTYKADLWSVGVITYMLLSNSKPFWGRSRSEIADQIMGGKLKFDKPRWKHISQQAKNFVASLIRLDPNKRLNADEALAHPWLHATFPLSDRRPDKTTLCDVANRLANYADGGEFRRLALMVIAYKSTAQDIAKLRQVFELYDCSNDGTITLEGFKKGLEECCNLSDEDLKELFDRVDIDKSGVLDYTEFLAATLETMGNIEENRIAEAFDRLDEDSSGFISFENLRKILGRHYTKEKVDQFISEADADNDGQISYEDFKQMLRRCQVEEIRCICCSMSPEEQNICDKDRPVENSAITCCKL